jgi:phosphatidylglycerol lysyltransferase
VSATSPYPSRMTPTTDLAAESAAPRRPPLWKALWGSLPALLLLVNALVNLLTALLPRQHGFLFWTEHLLPVEITESARGLLFLSGILLLALTHGIARHKHMAWVLTETVLALSIALHLGREFDWDRALLCGILFTMLWTRRARFVAQSDQPSVRWGLLMLAPLLLGTLAFGWVSLGHLSHSLRGPTDPLTRLQTVAELVFLQDTDTLAPASYHAQIVFNTISAGGLAAGAVAVGLFLRPVFRRRGPAPTERERASALVQGHADDAVQPFALLPDKHYFFHGEGMVSYALWRNIPVVLGDPVAAPETAPEVIREFASFCRVQDWTPVFYNCTERNLGVFRELGWKSMRISEDAALDLRTFELKGKKFQNLRTALNKAEREGTTFEFHQGADLDKTTGARLREISQNWLETRNGQEMGFDLGHFDLEQFREHGVTLARGAEGKILGFTSWLPYAGGAGRVLDLMRAPEEVHGIMDYLITKSLLHFQAQGVQSASLGNAPLASLAELTPESPLPDKVRHYLYENFNHYYGFKSLFAFKLKFQPTWTPRYLVYPADPVLPLAALALIRVHLPEGLWRYLRS